MMKGLSVKAEDSVVTQKNLSHRKVNFTARYRNCIKTQGSDKDFYRIDSGSSNGSSLEDGGMSALDSCSRSNTYFEDDFECPLLKKILFVQEILRN
eukprot:UN02329